MSFKRNKYRYTILGGMTNEGSLEEILKILKIVKDIYPSYDRAEMISSYHTFLVVESALPLVESINNYLKTLENG